MSHIWCINKWAKYIDTAALKHCSGLRMRYEKNIHPEVRIALVQFADWLRCEFTFPVRVNVYVKSTRRIKAIDGDFVVGTIWRPDDFTKCPYIRLATGDYLELVSERGKEQAIIAILHTFAHELTHYFQHINKLELTAIGEERQATAYANYIISDYMLTHNTGNVSLS